MQRPNVIWLVGFVIGLLALTGRGQNTDPTVSIDPKADEILKQMGRLLGETPQFSVKADKMIDYVLENGQKIQLSNRTQVVVHRPGKLWARTIGDTGTEQGWYANNSLILLNEDQNSYTQMEVPQTIDTMMDFLAQQYGWSFPLADLVFSDPYRSAREKIRVGQYLGVHYVREIKCHHLAFRQEGLDWQIWIDAGGKPLPRKLVITDKESPGYPQFIAILEEWNLSPKIPEDQFDGKIPPGATKVDAATLHVPVAPTSATVP